MPYHISHLCCERCVVKLGDNQKYVIKGGFPYCTTCTQQDLPHCRGCRLPIAGDVLVAMEAQWHPEHFQCAACHKPLNELFGVRFFYTDSGLPYCEADYSRLTAKKEDLSTESASGRKGAKPPVPMISVASVQSTTESVEPSGGMRSAVTPSLRLKTPRTRAFSFTEEIPPVREEELEKDSQSEVLKSVNERVRKLPNLLSASSAGKESLSVTKNYSFGIARSHGMLPRTMAALAQDRRGSFLLPKETREEYVRVTETKPQTPKRGTESLTSSSPVVPSLCLSLSASPAVPMADTPDARLEEALVPTEGQAQISLEFLAPTPTRGSADHEEEHEAPAKCLLSSAVAIDSIDDVLDVGEVIGKGGFAIVKKATMRKSGEEVAMKLFNKWELQKGDALIFLQREIDTLREISHPNIRELRDVFEDQHYIYVVMEYVAGESLFELVERVDTLSEKDTQAVVRSLLEVLAYMHSIHYIHQDVKTENMMIPAGSSEPFRDMKVIDFGFARQVLPGEFLREYCGSYHYLAPEMITRQPYDLKVDLWSVGVVTYILLTGLRPFFSQAEATAGAIQWFDEDWEVISPEARDFVVALLTVDPISRLDAKAALEHPWFSVTPSSPQREEQ